MYLYHRRWQLCELAEAAGGADQLGGDGGADDRGNVRRNLQLTRRHFFFVPSG